jgi:hypothetical protein
MRLVLNTGCRSGEKVSRKSEWEWNIMSEMRKFLIYEIPGLLSVIYFSIIYCFYNSIGFADLIKIVSPNPGFIVPVIAYPIGWFGKRANFDVN